MHGMGHIGSAAVPVFLAGSKRTCSPSRLGLRWLEHALPNRRGYGPRLRAKDHALARQTAEQNPSLHGQADPTIVEPPKAKTYGLVEDIVELSKTGADGMGVAVWTT